MQGLQGRQRGWGFGRGPARSWVGGQQAPSTPPVRSGESCSSPSWVQSGAPVQIDFYALMWPGNDHQWQQFALKAFKLHFKSDSGSDMW